MPYDVQIVIDCAEPHPLADWWAEALDWVVEPTDEAFIRDMVSKGYAEEADTTTYEGALVWRSGAAITPTDTAEDGPRRRILFQQVPEGKSVKNRVHLDIWVGEEARERELARLVAAGATFLHRGEQGPHQWVTIADPEGNELCLS